VQTTCAGNVAEARIVLTTSQIDCIAIDISSSQSNGIGIIGELILEFGLEIPVVVYSENDLNEQQKQELKRLSRILPIKQVTTPERLFEEISLFLHRIKDNLPTAQQEMLEELATTDPVLAGKKVLIVDDDVRNIFALTSILERYQMVVIHAENGNAGIEILQTTPDIDVVLMDVMMPEMDGYETMRSIRQINAFRGLPIIALTAKAMKGDREKCLNAGASDYITKPVDIEQLLSLLRVWLSQ
jgi:CheY-like chemotaxis protein